MASLAETPGQTQGHVPVPRRRAWRRSSRRIPGVDAQTTDLSAVIRLAARARAHRSVLARPSGTLQSMYIYIHTHQPFIITAMVQSADRPSCKPLLNEASVRFK